MKPIVLMLAVLAGLAGCGDDAEKEATATPTATATPGTGPLVTYTRTGGFASQPITLTVDRDGTATVDVEGPEASHKTFTVSESDMAAIQESLDAARDADGPKANYGCADCYVYMVDGDGVKYTLDDVSYTDDATPIELVVLVSQLQEVTGMG